MNKTTKPKKAKKSAKQIITKPENLIIVPDILPEFSPVYDVENETFDCPPLNYLLAGLRE